VDAVSLLKVWYDPQFSFSLDILDRDGKVLMRMSGFKRAYLIEKAVLLAQRIEAPIELDDTEA
jgi:hypothetical protein